MAEAAFPLLLKANSGWLGNDGNWSTFSIGVGSPHQLFNVVPSTAGGETWVPLADGCSTQIPNCVSSRGAVASQNGGFLSNESTTWEQIGSGIYELGLENALFSPADNGLYGQDVVSIDNGTYNITDQTVAGFTTGNFWLGSLGLGVQRSSFVSGQSNMPTLLTGLKSANLTSSMSYGYAAGSSSRLSPGSLVFGGYDADAFVASNISFKAFSSGARSLTVNLRSLLASNTLQGYSSLPIDAGGFNMSIDSTVSQMWLPGAVCDSLANSLGLSYDSQTGYYLLNSTTRSQLMATGTYFTFSLAPDSTSPAVNIKIPWRALDFTIGEPIYTENVPYFPIRRAANATQYVLGRAFLQEAYIVVDWDRMNFTIGQATQTTSTSNNIVPILPPSFETTPSSAPKAPGGGGSSNGQPSSSWGKSSAGTYAGIAIGVIAVVAIACGAVWYVRKRKRRQQDTMGPESAVVEHFPDDKGVKQIHEFVQEVPGSPPPPGYKEMPSPMVKPQMMHTPVHELGGETRHHLMSTPVYELPGGVVGHELSVSPREREGNGFPFPRDLIEPAERTS